MGRKQDRAHAMKLIFRLGFAAVSRGNTDVAEEYIRDFAGAETDDDDSAPKNAEKVDAEYLDKAYAGVTKNIEEIDRIIDESAAGWKTTRISKTDLAILRLAVYEMLFGGDVPAGVAVNEAVELAKVYSSDDSPSFVNGVLGRICDVYASARRMEKKK